MADAPIPSTLIEALDALPADRHPVAVYLARLGPGSRRTMAQALDAIAGVLTDGRSDARQVAWRNVRHQHTQAVRARLAEKFQPATCNKMLAGLRGVLREAWRLGQMSAEDFHRAIDLPSIKSHTLPRGRALATGEIRALFDVCCVDASPAGVRDAAILAVLYGGGLRREEVVRLDLEHYDTATGALTIRSAKGRKDRVAYATNGAAEVLTAWLTVRGTESGPLFVPIRKGGTLEFRRMIPHAVFKMLRKRGEQAGLKAFSPHDLRRTFISDLLDNGADISTVQHLAGHANVTTTARYDRRGEVAKRKAAELLHVPFRTQE